MLTNSQLSQLSSFITSSSDSTITQYRTEGATGALSEYLNTAGTKVVWRSSVPQDEIMQNGFDWVQVDNLSVGKARIWEWLFNNEGRVMNPSKPNVRAGIDEAWKGTAAMLAVRAAIYSHCKRFATKAEEVFASGTGTDASPANLTFEGQVSDYDIVRALNNDF